MIDPRHSGGTLAPASLGEPAGALTFRSGREIVAVAEALYLRLFVIALGCLPFVCGLAIVVALVRTENANFVRTTALALAMALLAVLVLQVPVRVYRAMRRWPLLSLVAPGLALGALAIDGVLYSPLSFPAAVSIAFPAFVCGRRWALAAAALIAVGALTTATWRAGLSALDSVGQGTAGYFVWALVLAGLAERFARLVMQMAPVATPATTVAPSSIPVPNLAGDPLPTTSKAANPSTPPSLPSSCETLSRTFLLCLRARIGVCWDAGEHEQWGRDRFASASRRRAEGNRSRAGRGGGCPGSRARRAAAPSTLLGAVQA